MVLIDVEELASHGTPADGRHTLPSLDDLQRFAALGVDGPTSG